MLTRSRIQHAALIPFAALAWSFPQPAGPVSLGDVSATFTGISCPSATLCVASESDGVVLVSTAPQSGPTSWQPVELAPGAKLIGVSCPSASLCATATSDGRVFVTTAPAGPPPAGPASTGAATPAPTSASWSETALGGLGLVTALSCAPDGSCALADDAGDIAASAAAAGAPAPGAGPPGAGASTASWTVTHVDSATRPCHGGRCQAGFTSIACPSASECVAFDQVGNVLSSSTPEGPATAWQSADVGYRGYSQARAQPGCGSGYCATVRCPSASTCIALDSGGWALTSDAPLGPQTAWVARKLPPLAAAPTALDCPAAAAGAAAPSSNATTCAMLDAAGELLVTSDPAGGVTAWNALNYAPQAPADLAASAPGPGQPTAIACPSSALCVATDNAGNLRTAIAPASAAQVLASAKALARPLGTAANPSAPLTRGQLAGAGELAFALNAPQGGVATVRVTIALRGPGPAPKRPKKGKRLRRRTTVTLPPIALSTRALVLGPGPAGVTLALTQAQRAELRRATSATALLSARFTTTGGLSRTARRSITLGR